MASAENTYAGHVHFSWRVCVALQSSAAGVSSGMAAIILRGGLAGLLRRLLSNDSLLDGGERHVLYRHLLNLLKAIGVSSLGSK